MSIIEQETPVEAPELPAGHFPSVEAAIAGAHDVIAGITAIMRLGKRLVVLTDNGSVYLLQGPSADRYFAQMREVIDA